jgi:hypothetical protein
MPTEIKKDDLLHEQPIANDADAAKQEESDAEAVQLSEVAARINLLGKLIIPPSPAR